MLLYMIYVLTILVRTKIVNNEYAVINMYIYLAVTVYIQYKVIL